MTTTTLVEIIRFQESGLSEIDARTKAFAQEVDHATARAKALESALGSGAYAAHATQVAAVEARYERASLAARNLAFRQQAATGVVQQQTLAVQQLNRQHEVTQARVRNQVVARDLRSGAYFEHARAMAVVNREQERLQKQATLQQLVAEHGRLGGVLKANAGHVQRMKAIGIGAGIGAVGLGMGLMRSGLQGTVTGYQLEVAWLRLSRQIAAVAIPAVEKVSAVIGRVAGWFERLDGAQQNTILTLGLLAVGVAAVAPVAMSAVAAIGALTTSVLALRTAAISSAGAQATAAAVSGASTIGTGAAATAAAGGGGLAASMARGNWSQVPGAKAVPPAAATVPPAAKTASGVVAAGAAGLGMIGAAGLNALLQSRKGLSMEGLIPGYGLVRDVHRQATGRQADPNSALGARRNPTIMDRAIEGAVPGYAILQLLRRRTGMTDGDPADSGQRRRDVTPLQVSQEELGGAWNRIQEEVLKATVARDEERKEKEAKDREDATKAQQDAARANQRSAENLGDLAWDLRNWIRRQM